MAITLSNSQYDTLMQVYQKLRFEAEMSAQKNRVLAYQKIPELYDIDSEFIEATRNRDTDLNALADTIKEKKKKLLIENKLPSDFLDIHYTCPDCNDTGFIGGDRCHCFKNMIIKLIYGGDRWVTTFERENFSTFDLSFYKDSNDKSGDALSAAEDALKKAKQFSSSIINGECIDYCNLLILGNTGVGKTFLCNCIAKELIENDKFIVYLPAPSLFELFEKVSFSGRRSEDEFSDEVKNIHYSNIFDCDLLIIDDLGTECPNNFTNSKLLDLVNKRLLANLPTLISTNLDMEGIREQYSERLLSRIAGNYKLIHLYGDDIRHKKRKKLSLCTD